MKRNLLFIAISIFSIFLAAIVALNAEGQNDPGNKQGKTTFQVETDLVEVRVVVTDDKGRIVEGLQKKDFELFENDKPLEISHFVISKIEEGRDRKEPAGNAAADKEARLQRARALAERPPVRTILLYVDALHMSFANHNWVKKALNRFIDEQLTDQDLVAFTSSESLGVAQQFTRDRRILRHAVDQMRFSVVRDNSVFTPSMAVGVLQDRMDDIQMAVDVLRREENIMCPCLELRQRAYHRAMQVINDASYSRQNTLSIIENFTEQMRHLPGKRMIIVFSEGFTSYNRIGELQNDEIEKALSRAVQSGVVIYTIDAKGLTGPSSIDVEIRGGITDDSYSRLRECYDQCDPSDLAYDQCIQACQSQFASQFMCREDLENPDPVCDSPSPGALDSYLLTSEREMMNGLHSLAQETGGQMYENTNDFNESLSKALEDNSFYYILSYYLSDAENENPFRRIDVRVRNHPGYKIRTPRGFWFSKKKEDAADEILKTPQERLIKAMGSPIPVTDIGVSAIAHFVETEDDDNQVTLTVLFEGDSLRYEALEQGGAMKMEILSFIFDSAGNQVEGLSSVVEAKMTQENIERAKADGYRYTRRLTLKPGVYQVRIGVREEGSDRMGTATTWMEIPEVIPDELEMSSLILSNPLDMDLWDSEGIGVNELEQIKMIQGVPMYATDDIFYYSFRIHKSSQPSAGKNLLLKRELLQGGTLVKEEEWRTIEDSLEEADSKGWFDLDGELDIQDLDPGVYELQISVKEETGKNALLRAVTFGIL